MTIYSKTPPTEPGLYWVRWDKNGEEEIMRLHPEVLPHAVMFGPKIPSAEDLAIFDAVLRNERGRDRLTPEERERHEKVKVWIERNKFSSHGEHWKIYQQWKTIERLAPCPKWTKEEM